MSRDGIEKMSVVRYHQHGLLYVAQVVFEPLHGVEVEVVGGLIEQEVIGVAEKGFGEHHPHFLAVGQLGHTLIV